MAGEGLALIGAFFLTSLAIEITPGPNMAYLALVGVSRGRGDGLMAVVGVALGLALLGTIVGVGLGSLLLENRVIYEALRWGGAAYLCYLAWDAWKDGQEELGAHALPQSRWVYFRRGLITNLLNPKAALFYVAVLPSFIDPARSVPEQTAVLVAVYTLAATLVHAGIVLAAATLSPLFQEAAFRRRTALGAAILLVGVAIWLLVKTAA